MQLMCLLSNMQNTETVTLSPLTFICGFIFWICGPFRIALKRRYVQVQLNAF